MKVYTLKREQFLPIGVEEAWDYFSSPRNLSEITPEKLDFEIISELDDKMYPGMIIKYFVKPLLGIKLRWVTEITHVKEYEYFVDEQRVGPYKLWHHQHRFIETDGGVLMQDEVNYALPFGPLGQFLHSIMIKSDLNYIFEFRSKVIKTIFPEKLTISKGAA